MQSDILKGYQVAVFKDFQKALKKCNRNGTNNLPPVQNQALQELKSNNSIIIKKADNGGAAVVLNQEDYISEVVRQLEDTNFNEKLDGDPSPQPEVQISNILKDLYKHKMISKVMYQFIKVGNPRPGQFYILSKIHKPGNPGCPIVSSNNIATERISELVDLLSQATTKNTTIIYIQDSTHFLQQLVDIENNTTLPHDLLLCTLDVTSLYTNILHKEGIQSCKKALQTSRQSYPKRCHIMPAN